MESFARLVRTYDVSLEADGPLTSMSMFLDALDRKAAVRTCVVVGSEWWMLTLVSRA